MFVSSVHIPMYHHQANFSVVQHRMHKAMRFGAAGHLNFSKAERMTSRTRKCPYPPGQVVEDSDPRGHA